MDDLNKKIQRLNRPPSLFNWVRVNFRRLDDTRKHILQLADNPPRRSIAPIHKICTELAYRQITFEAAMDKTKAFKEYHKMVATEVLPAFYNYFIANQVETLPELNRETFNFPVGKANNKTKSISIAPTYISIRGEKIIPVFVLGWTKIPFDYHQKRLISTLVHRAILTRQDYIGGDAQVLTFTRAKWSSSDREVGEWMISQFDPMSDTEMQEQFDRYNKAVREVIAELQSRDDEKS